jgi:predicted RNA-binding Zn ribbon-like protein
VDDIPHIPLVGGHPALDLVNTCGRRDPVEYLPDRAALLAWASRAGIVDDAEAAVVGDAWRVRPRAARAAVADVRALREVVHTVVLGAIGFEPVSQAALDVLHARWVAAAGRSSLVLHPAAVPPVRLAVGMVPALLIPDRLAAAAAELVCTVDPARLRRCPTQEGGCGWLFLDRSRNGSRRWCRMADCGTEVKSQRLTERRRAARGPGR